MDSPAAIQAEERRRITVADVTASLSPDAVRGNHWVVRLCRPLANLCTPFFYNAGFSADACTGLRAIASTAAVAALAAAGDFPWAGWIACVLFYVGYLLDCIDGNVARLSERVTFFGKFIDGLGDLVYFVLAPTAAGFAAFRVTGSTALLLLGVAASLFIFANHMTRFRLSFFREWMVAQSGPLGGDIAARMERFGAVEKKLGAVWVNVTFLLPLLLIPPGGIVAYLWPMAVVEIAVSGAWVVLTMLQARAILSRVRRSRHSRAASAP
jgi:phosphatidylglycerophosphate synthase